VVNVTSDLFGAPLGSDVLSPRQLRAPTVAGEADQVLGHHRHGPPRALLPRRIGRRVDHNLTHDSPARVMRIAASYEKARERLCNSDRSGLGSVAVEMSQCRAHVTSVLYRPRELMRALPLLAGLILDRRTEFAARPQARSPVHDA
jgi:hypothetical protein